MRDAHVSYNHHVRRLLAISLVVLFCFPLISALFALAPNSDASLPACCRRSGVHHCEMDGVSERSQSTRLAAVRQKCPAYPKAIAPVRHEELSPISASLLLTAIATHPVGKRQSVIFARITLDRSRQERGPPAFVS